MDDKLRSGIYGTSTVSVRRPQTAPAYGKGSRDKHEQLRNRVESQLRARINETKKRTSQPSSSSLSQSQRSYSIQMDSSKGSTTRQNRLREMLEAYSFSSNNRSKSANSRSPPPVLRRRLARPGRPIVTVDASREIEPESSESPVNFRRIHRRLMPPRPSSVSMIQRHQDTSSLNSTFNVKSQSLRSRLADLSQTMRIIEDKSSSVSPPPIARQRKPADTMRLIEDIRRRAAEISRGSSMFVDESNMPSMVIPREAPDTPVQHSRDTFIPPLNHLSRSIRDIHPSSPRAISPANWVVRDHHSSLLMSSPSPSVSSLGLVEEESAAINRRKEQVRAELEQKQRDLADSLRHSDHAVISLESLNVVGSSVRSLSELIRAKEAEIEAKKSAYISRKSEFEIKQKQLDYLKQLEQEEAKIEMDTLALSDCLPIPEEVSVPPLPSPPPSLPHQVTQSPPPVSSGKRTPEIYSISSPIRQVRDVSDLSPVSEATLSVPIPIPDYMYEKLGIEEMILEHPPEEDDLLTADLLMSPLDNNSHSPGATPELEDISNTAKDVSLPTEVLVTGEAEGVFTLSVEEDWCDHMEFYQDEVTTTVPSEVDEIADLVVSSLIDSILSEQFIDLDNSKKPEHLSLTKPSSPRINTRIDSFDIVESSQIEPSSHSLNASLIVQHILESVTSKIWVKTDEELSDIHLNHIRSMVDFEDVLSAIVPSSSVAVCLADAFLVLVDSFPPAIAAEREWQVKFPGSHSPVAGFLPGRHTLDSLTSAFVQLIESYNKSLSSDHDISQIETFLCHEYLKKSKCDEILFQCNDSDMWTRFDSNTCSRAEAEIVEEVSLFVLEAIVTSVASDFQT